jgi:hypothetical protein
MSENPFEAIERLEKLAAWHRINAERAGADWVWEARLRTAEDLERQAAKIREQLPAERETAHRSRLEAYAGASAARARPRRGTGRGWRSLRQSDR